MFGVGQTEVVILLIIVLIIFGPKNLPKLANSMGRAITDFKRGLSGIDKDLRDEVEKNEAEEKARAAQSAATPPAPPKAE